MSADVQLDDVWIKFGDFVAARDVNIHIDGGEFFSFLGPSGCGKTTLLRAVSGFLEPTQGKILIGVKNMAGIGPNRRPTALIFQNLALFPLMSVWENIAFALEVKGVSKTNRLKKADELLELIDRLSFWYAYLVPLTVDGAPYNAEAAMKAVVRLNLRGSREHHNGRRWLLGIQAHRVWGCP